jgi:hypothetical protein
MHASRTRFLIASVVILSSFACTDSGENPIGPSEMELDPVTATEPAFSVSSGSDSCLAAWDISGTTPGEASPCDAAHGRGGYRGVYFLPSLVGNPNISGELLSGLARNLIFEVVPFSCSGPGCETTRLQVREKGGVYAASWTINKKDANLAETYWRVRVSLDTGDGEPVPLAYRDVFQTNSPSSDQPSDGPTLDIQFGSTQSVKVFIQKNACSNVDQAESITCLIGDEGGSLGLITPVGQEIKLDIGTGNGARSYTLATSPLDVNVDVRLIGDAVSVTADPPFAAGERLNGSEIRFCEPAEFDTSGGNDAYVIQQDEYGQSVLPSVDVSCPLFSTSVGLLDNLGARFASLASLFAPRSLIATAAVKSSGGGGGTLQRLSDFQLAELPSASIAAGDGQTITEGETIDDHRGRDDRRERPGPGGRRNGGAGCDDPVLRGIGRRADLFGRIDGRELRGSQRGGRPGDGRLDAFGRRGSQAVCAGLRDRGGRRGHADDADGRDPGRAAVGERRDLRSRSDGGGRI